MLSCAPVRPMTLEASRLSLGPGLVVLPDELKAAIVLFYTNKQGRKVPG